MINQAFGSWLVIEDAGLRGKGTRYWLCKCKCGTVKELPQHTLRTGQSIQCVFI